jgi:hypothetical protein
VSEPDFLMLKCQLILKGDEVRIERCHEEEPSEDASAHRAPWEVEALVKFIDATAGASAPSGTTRSGHRVPHLLRPRHEPSPPDDADAEAGERAEGGAGAVREAQERLGRHDHSSTARYDRTNP